MAIRIINIDSYKFIKITQQQSRPNPKLVGVGYMDPFATFHVIIHQICLKIERS
jgi:hypothetical protein